MFFQRLKAWGLLAPCAAAPSSFLPVVRRLCYFAVLTLLCANALTLPLWPFFSILFVPQKTYTAAFDRFFLSCYWLQLLSNKQINIINGITGSTLKTYPLWTTFRNDNTWITEKNDITPYYNNLVTICKDKTHYFKEEKQVFHIHYHQHLQTILIDLSSYHQLSVLKSFRLWFRYSLLIRHRTEIRESEMPHDVFWQFTLPESLLNKTPHLTSHHS